ncbi:hypothetical protein BU25DRAFT_239781 [Macroventuria anomochaeta]|uniref:Uncharacterized protein n=1 Tax=Macroventuria anomochaeta TaxID=301207 RepID=A0ACB6RHW7_9PLEO|nr:uncharacterized protein BU25DRAFT_239781 [Macroventuria anomochaeta]KAF2621287.1 hypothetical protein BU25DRAFT_239781 [Macroventuria anomochaeta]
MMDKERSFATAQIRDLVVSKMRAGTKAEDLASKFGLSCCHVRDLCNESSRPTGDMPKRRMLTDEERDCTISELQAGARKVDVAYELGPLDSTIRDLFWKFRAERSTASRPISSYTSECVHLEDLGFEIEDLFLLQWLKPVEVWIEEIQDQITALERRYPEGFAWQYLQEMVKTFSNSVQMMGLNEIQRARRMHEELDNLTEHMNKIDALLRQFGKEAEVSAGCVKLSLKRPTSDEDEDIPSFKRHRINLSAPEDVTSSSDSTPVDSP